MVGTQETRNHLNKYVEWQFMRNLETREGKSTRNNNHSCGLIKSGNSRKSLGEEKQMAKE